MEKLFAKFKMEAEENARLAEEKRRLELNATNETPIEEEKKFCRKVYPEMINDAVAPRIQIASDLHIEFFEDDYSSDDNYWDNKHLLDPSCDILALLGDIGVVTSPQKRAQYQSFLGWCCEKFTYVLVLTGNHEYYNLDNTSTTIEEVDHFIDNMQDVLPNLIFMNQRNVVLGGVRILGTTLWSSIPNKAAAKEVEDFLNDYQLIFKQGPGVCEKRLRASDSNSLHEEQLKWLTESLTAAQGKEPNVPVVVLTHHTPSMTGTSDPRYEQVPLPIGYRNCGFSSPLDHLLVEYPVIRCWCYGHTHYNNEQTTSSGARLISNQRGYDGSLSLGYKANLVVDVTSA
mmetsp:Transcript_11919/g.19400  ORF Transcript_11919/g.19400 Transcript_11919/m.19400 type:complete len:343 (-) Transcript_11919:3169-4197(-)